MQKFRCTLLVILLGLPMLSAGAGVEGPRAKTLWTPKKPIWLNGIAENVYGHQAYARMIAVYNRLPVDKVVPAGTVIKTPPLPVLFKDIGLFPKYESQFVRIFGAIEKYRAFLPAYKTVRKKGNGYFKAGTIALPEGMGNQLLALATSIKLSVTELRESAEKTGNVPAMTLNQFTEAATILRELAAGKVDGYGYDEDMVEQRLAHGLADAVAWSRE
jgi:hypothetical protein